MANRLTHNTSLRELKPRFSVLSHLYNRSQLSQNAFAIFIKSTSVAQGVRPIIAHNIQSDFRIIQSSSSPSPGLLSLPLIPSLRIGILIPWVAKHLLRGVLSITPGNFLAENTWKTSLKQDARTGAEAVLRV